MRDFDGALAYLWRTNEAEDLREQWVAREPEAIARVDALLATAGRDRESIAANAFVEYCDQVDSIDRMIAQRELRRNIAIGEIHRHREALGRQTRDAVKDFEDAEFEDLPNGADAQRAAAVAAEADAGEHTEPEEGGVPPAGDSANEGKIAGAAVVGDREAADIGEARTPKEPDGPPADDRAKGSLSDRSDNGGTQILHTVAAKTSPSESDADKLPTETHRHDIRPTLDHEAPIKSRFDFLNEPFTTERRAKLRAYIADLEGYVRQKN